MPKSVKDLRQEGITSTNINELYANPQLFLDLFEVDRAKADEYLKAVDIETLVTYAHKQQIPFVTTLLGMNSQYLLEIKYRHQPSNEEISRMIPLCNHRWAYGLMYDDDRIEYQGWNYSYNVDGKILKVYHTANGALVAENDFNEAYDLERNRAIKIKDQFHAFLNEKKLSLDCEYLTESFFDRARNFAKKKLDSRDPWQYTVYLNYFASVHHKHIEELLGRLRPEKALEVLTEELKGGGTLLTRLFEKSNDYWFGLYGIIDYLSTTNLTSRIDSKILTSLKAKSPTLYNKLYDINTSSSSSEPVFYMGISLSEICDSNFLFPEILLHDILPNPEKLIQIWNKIPRIAVGYLHLMSPEQRTTFISNSEDKWLIGVLLELMSQVEKHYYSYVREAYKLIVLEHGTEQDKQSVAKREAESFNFYIRREEYKHAADFFSGDVVDELKPYLLRELGVEYLSNMIILPVGKKTTDLKALRDLIFSPQMLKNMDDNFVKDLMTRVLKDDPTYFETLYGSFLEPSGELIQHCLTLALSKLDSPKFSDPFIANVVGQSGMSAFTLFDRYEAKVATKVAEKLKAMPGQYAQFIQSSKQTDRFREQLLVRFGVKLPVWLLKELGEDKVIFESDEELDKLISDFLGHSKQHFNYLVGCLPVDKVLLITNNNYQHYNMIVNSSPETTRVLIYRLRQNEDEYNDFVLRWIEDLGDNQLSEHLMIIIQDSPFVHTEAAIAILDRAETLSDDQRNGVELALLSAIATLNVEYLPKVLDNDLFVRLVEIAIKYKEDASSPLKALVDDILMKLSPQKAAELHAEYSIDNGDILQTLNQNQVFDSARALYCRFPGLFPDELASVKFLKLKFSALKSINEGLPSAPPPYDDGIPVQVKPEPVITPADQDVDEDEQVLALQPVEKPQPQAVAPVLEQLDPIQRVEIPRVMAVNNSTAAPVLFQARNVVEMGTQTEPMKNDQNAARWKLIEAEQEIERLKRENIQLASKVKTTTAALGHVLKAERVLEGRGHSKSF